MGRAGFRGGLVAGVVLATGCGAGAPGDTPAPTPPGCTDAQCLGFGLDPASALPSALKLLVLGGPGNQQAPVLGVDDQQQLLLSVESVESQSASVMKLSAEDFHPRWLRSWDTRDGRPAFLSAISGTGQTQIYSVGAPALEGGASQPVGLVRVSPSGETRQVWTGAVDSGFSAALGADGTLASLSGRGPDEGWQQLTSVSADGRVQTLGVRGRTGMAVLDNGQLLLAGANAPGQALVRQTAEGAGVGGPDLAELSPDGQVIWNTAFAGCNGSLEQVRATAQGPVAFGRIGGCTLGAQTLDPLGTGRTGVIVAFTPTGALRWVSALDLGTGALPFAANATTGELAVIDAANTLHVLHADGTAGGTAQLPGTASTVIAGVAGHWWVGGSFEGTAQFGQGPVTADGRDAFVVELAP